MNTTPTTYECHGWTVEHEPPRDPDDYTWVVYDRDHDEYGCEETRDEAIELCRKHGLADAKERLWTTITEETDLDEVSLETLQQVAKLLGLEDTPS